MYDLISRQAAIEELSYCQTFLYDSMDKYPKIELGDAKAVLEALPAAEPRKGKWEVINEKEEVYSCSECGFVAWGKAEISNYCPNCGSRMEEEND